MRNIFFGIVIAVVVVFGLRYFEHRKDATEQSILIQNELKNVSKLIVAEGTYAQVYTYENFKTLYFDFLLAKKKALVVVNAEASIAYDLSQLEIEVDTDAKEVRITNIPEPELTINPKIEYYDVQQDYLNLFDEDDYNKIRQEIEDSLRKTIQRSPLVTNAQNRFFSEIQKLFILTHSMGWTLYFDGTLTVNESDLKSVKY
ncbi:MAG: DUF4230 domain-containing protein [Flavobacteriaceae bacterium]|nr:DUF4230 domain-containing protein [Flavobacteriaceae bacterium]